MSYQTSFPPAASGENSDAQSSPHVLPSSDEATSPLEPPTRSHESIWKRSKKILGMGRFEFLRKNYADNSSDKESGSQDGKNGVAKPAVSKRREQVRRAQKTHRQRTEHYIKALEQEVLRLQKVEEESLQHKEQKKKEAEYISALEHQVVKLQTEETATFMVGNVEINSGFEVGNYLARVTMSKKDENGRSTLHAEMPQNFLTAPSAPAVIESSSNHLSQSQFTSYWDQLGRVNSLANHQSAVDFVLCLEFGCMNHVHPLGISHSTVSGHTLTTSATLLEQAPEVTDGPASWNASCTVLDRLFLLSPSLNLTSELTPIQAWNEIWKHSDAHLIGVQDLNTLKQELGRIIVCYGFGGVIDATALSAILEKIIVSIKKGRIC